MQNPYAVLGLTPDAGMAETKRAYRKKAKKLHPDVSGSDAEQFRLFYAVYKALSDERANLFKRAFTVQKPQIIPITSSKLTFFLGLIIISLLSLINQSMIVFLIFKSSNLLWIAFGMIVNYFITFSSLKKSQSFSKGISSSLSLF